MAKYAYLIKIAGGRGNKEHTRFLKNMLELNAKTFGFGGIESQCVVSHHVDGTTVQLLASEGMNKNRNDVTVEEITDSTMKDPATGHQIFRDLIDSFYLPYDTFHNIKRKKIKKASEQ